MTQPTCATCRYSRVMPAYSYTVPVINFPGEAIVRECSMPGRLLCEVPMPPILERRFSTDTTSPERDWLKVAA